MDINITHLIEGARKAKGLTIIIDVFRAFSTACYVFNNGAKRIIPVGNLDLAYSLKKQNPDFVLMGERKGIMPPGFDYGNSPTYIQNIDFTNKEVIHTTSAGTQGIANAINADEIITGSFVNAQAIVNYIKARDPAQVSLVCVGLDGIKKTDEDTLCAQYIRNALENKPNNFSGIVNHLRMYRSADEFFNPEKKWSPKKDFYLCLNLDAFDFVLKAELFKDNIYSLEKRF
ncbi:hypothetical protein AYK26_02200 [Euryarchaeota archaeon SM23-78]|nr:MAG: hypothetical protein AYK26_02200 [Euryarchaeota archaeon SM23-78]MBW3000907.1 2-phosphosulfolactate phosphatase [Candidatus Woesearchaeota archaeon]